jgi:hypothetical protein
MKAYDTIIYRLQKIPQMWILMAQKKKKKKNSPFLISMSNARSHYFVTLVSFKKECDF